MKKIGFIDYYLSEWHANNYPAWIRKASENAGVDYRVAYAYAEKEISPVDGVSTDEWCKSFGAERCGSIGELCEKSDVILILAPSDPDKHLPYAEQALPYGKITYIDKTFAPDAETAEKIFALADRYNTPVFTSSALRYGTELAEMGKPTAVITTGGGSNAPEYIIHQAEMVVKLLCDEPTAVTCVRQGGQCVFHADFAHGAKATMVYAPPLPFTVCAAEADRAGKYAAIASDTFGGLIADIIRFYESGKPSFERAQTMQVMRLREMALKALDTL